MSLEVVGAWAAKLGWTGIIPYLIWSHKRDKVKLDNTYSKKETNELIDLKIEPVRLEYNGKTDSLHEKFDDKFGTLLELVKSNNEQNTLQRKENTDMLHEIRTSVAVVENEIKNIKESQQKQ